MFSAQMVGVAEILEIGWLGGVTTNIGEAKELTVIAAVNGGAHLAGGSGTAFDAAIGALLIEVIRNSLILLAESHVPVRPFRPCHRERWRRGNDATILV